MANLTLSLKNISLNINACLEASGTPIANVSRIALFGRKDRRTDF